MSVQTIDRNGNRVLIGSDEHIQAFDARTSSTVGVWTWATETGWTKDDQDFDDVDKWRSHVNRLIASA